MTSILPLIQTAMMRYGMTTYLALGNIGNVLALLLFSSKNHRHNPCSLYLGVGSLINIIGINLGIVPLIYALDHADPLPLSLTLCKGRQYSLHAILMINRTLIVFACFDRFAVSNGRPSIRQWSNIKLARYFTIAVILFWFIFCIHILIYQDIQNGSCGMFGTYSFIFTIYSIFIIGLIPPLLMIIFGILTIRNLKQIHVQQVHLHQRDRQLFIILMAEVIVYLTCTALNPVSIAYTTLTSNISNKSIERIQIESFISFFIRNFLIYIFHTTPFYIYFISSNSFRKECKKFFFHQYKQRILPNRILHTNY